MRSGRLRGREGWVLRFGGFEIEMFRRMRSQLFCLFSSSCCSSDTEIAMGEI